MNKKDIDTKDKGSQQQRGGRFSDRLVGWMYKKILKSFNSFSKLQSGNSFKLTLLEELVEESKC